MRRRLAAFLLATLIVLPVVATASAAEPSATPPPDATASTGPTPSAEPTPESSAAPAASAIPADPTAPPATPATTAPADASPATPAAPTGPAVAKPPTKINGGLDATGRYIVMLKAGTDTVATVGRVATRADVRADRTFSRAVRGFTASLDASQRRALLKDPNVQAIVPDEIIHLTAQTTPTGVSRVGAKLSPVANINGLDDRVDADVAIVDTGIGPHPDLNIAGGYNCSTPDRAAWADNNGHGTHVAGTVAALDNDFGVVGVAPGARLWAVKILNGDGYGYLSWYVCGLDWVLAQRDPNDSSRPLIEAVNMSVAKAGTDDANCGLSNADILHQAICRLVVGGITVVAAAANDGASATHRVPAAYNEVITVSALADTDGKAGGVGGRRCYSWAAWDKDDTFANFSNYGYDVDLIAPGKCIWSTKPGPTYGYSSGTSMAAPAVTGAVALYKASRPMATPAQVKEALQYLGNLNWKTSTDPDSRHEKLLDVSRLDALGTFSVSAAQVPAVGERGGPAAVPITLGRSATFFERVSFSVGSLPSGWSAAFDKTSLLGWTANATTLRLTLPNPTRAGTYHVDVFASNQGRVLSSRATVVVENDLPTANAPTVSFPARAKTGTGSVPATISWPAATDKTSAIAGYEVQLRRDGGAWLTVKSTSGKVRSFARGLAFNASYEARVRARDAADNWSAWAQATAPFRAVPVDDRRSSVRYTASWVRTASSAAIAHTLHRSTSLHAKINYTFTGRAIAAVGPLGPGRAKVRIFIDGAYQGTVNLRRAGTYHRRMFFTKAFTSSGTHRITLEIVSSGRVQLDAFIVLQ
jgi:subtilisin